MAKSNDDIDPKTVCFHCGKPLAPHAPELPWNSKRPHGPFFDSRNCRELSLKRHFEEPYYQPLPPKNKNESQYDALSRERIELENKRRENDARKHASSRLVDEFLYFSHEYDYRRIKRFEEEMALPKSITDLTIPDATRFAGHWIIAPPGRGKTTLLHYLFLKDAQKDAAIIVMDSKGDLVPPLSRLADIQDRIVLIEPDPDYPLALNPLDIPASSIAHTISLLEYVFSSLLEAKMTALQMTLFRNVLPAIVQCVPNPTMRVFRDIIENGTAKYQQYFDALNPLTSAFFEQQFNSKTYTDTRNQLLWRLDFLLTNPLIRAMFEAPKTKLDIGKEMDAGKIILINNSKDLLGDEGAEFFGRFFIALILAAAQKRSSRKPQDKLPCYVYIDECQSVIHRDPKIATILDECRSQKIGLILAHQRTQQINDQNVQDALFNCAIRMANSDDEAKFLSDKLRTTPEFLRGLPVGSFASYVRDLTPQALALSVPYHDLDALPQLTDAEQSALKDRMRSLYAFEPERAPQSHTEPEKAPQRPRAALKPAQSAASAEDHTKPATDW